MADGEDRPFTHSRNFTEFLDRYGLVRPDRAALAELVKGVQLTVPIDDARHLLPPLDVPVSYFHDTAPAAGPATYAGWRLQSQSVGGFYLTDAGILVGTGALTNQLGAAVWTPGAAVNPAVISTRTYQPSILVFTGSFAPIPADSIRVLNFGITYGPVYCPPGESLYIFNQAANTAIEGWFVVQEIP